MSSDKAMIGLGPQKNSIISDPSPIIALPCHSVNVCLEFCLNCWICQSCDMDLSKMFNMETWTTWMWLALLVGAFVCRRCHLPPRFIVCHRFKLLLIYGTIDLSQATIYTFFLRTMKNVKKR